MTLITDSFLRNSLDRKPLAVVSKSCRLKDNILYYLVFGHIVIDQRLITKTFSLGSQLFLP